MKIEEALRQQLTTCNVTICQLLMGNSDEDPLLTLEKMLQTAPPAEAEAIRTVLNDPVLTQSLRRAKGMCSTTGLEADLAPCI